jgi:hypothetical protein
VISKAAFIVGEVINAKAYVREALISIAKLIKDLLLVTSCRLHNNSSNNGSVAGLMEQVS